jgi:hypothetical protein
MRECVTPGAQVIDYMRDKDLEIFRKVCDRRFSQASVEVIDMSAIIQKPIFLNAHRTGNIIRAAGAIIRPIIRTRGGCSQP